MATILNPDDRSAPWQLQVHRAGRLFLLASRSHQAGRRRIQSSLSTCGGPGPRPAVGQLDERFTNATCAKQPGVPLCRPTGSGRTLSNGPRSFVPHAPGRRKGCRAKATTITRHTSGPVAFILTRQIDLSLTPSGPFGGVKRLVRVGLHPVGVGVFVMVRQGDPDRGRNPAGLTIKRDRH